ncbi:MAG: UDP-N-acetylmuramate--L-alanine ligase [Phycisphaerae bacterium]|nr:UDP-N-acetylmuramate--L-alanine ligase [Phycisphaerae bacterium]
MALARQAAALNRPTTPWDVKGKRTFLIGIGGSGMAGMARMLAARGAVVRGSDSTRQETTDALAAAGIAVSLDQSGPLPPDTELVVASAAIKPDHPQLAEAVRRGIPHFSYAQALGRCMLGRTAVCIAGTHGKSTTTAMLSCVLAEAGLDPTAILGATCRQLGGATPGPAAGFRLGSATIGTGPWAGKPGLLLAESCEFNRSFHNYHPTIGVVTAVEADHLDIYGTLDAVIESFAEFARRIAPAEEGGLLLIAHDNAHRREVAAGIAARVQTIGFNPAADWSVKHEPATRVTTLIGPDKRVVCQWQTAMPGEHNAMNAATAAALAAVLGAPPAVITRALSAFAGLDRRTQLLGQWRAASWPTGQGVRVYDDYGHHPTEVEVTLKALRQAEAPEKRSGRLVCVFQPHQHSRTRHLMEEFASAFSAADLVIVPHIYFVRDSEEEKTKVTAGDLVDRLRHKGVHAMHLYPFEAIVEHLQTALRPGDLLVVMGAGPVNQVAHALLKTTHA